MTGRVVYAIVWNTYMNETDPPKAETQDGRAEANKCEENARKAREAADRLFPGHEWRKVEDGIYLSPRRPIGKKTNYEGELRSARVLRDLGSTVYLVPEQTDVGGKKYDAIVDGLVFEFKNIAGNASTIETLFFRSRSQAPNVFLNLENSPLSKREILATLHGARNKPETPHRHGYDYHNKFSGGKIILKIRSQDDLVYMDVDDLKAQ